MRGLVNKWSIHSFYSLKNVAEISMCAFDLRPPLWMQAAYRYLPLHWIVNRVAQSLTEYFLVHMILPGSPSGSFKPYVSEWFKNYPGVVQCDRQDVSQFHSLDGRRAT